MPFKYLFVNTHSAAFPTSQKRFGTCECSWRQLSRKKQKTPRRSSRDRSASATRQRQQQQTTEGKERVCEGKRRRRTTAVQVFKMTTPSFLSEYELAREKQLAKNAKMMASLGILNHKSAIDKAVATSQARSPPSAAAEARKRQQQQQRSRVAAAAADGVGASPPSRASGRLRNKPAPVYRDDYSFLDDYDKPSRSKRGGGGGGSGSRGGRSPWDNTSWPLGDASRRAAESAQETMDSLPNPSFCKIMLPSMCSGGFWMEAPQGLPAHMPHGMGIRLQFHSIPVSLSQLHSCRVQIITARHVHSLLVSRVASLR